MAPSSRLTAKTRGHLAPTTTVDGGEDDADRGDDDDDDRVVGVELLEQLALVAGDERGAQPRPEAGLTDRDGEQNGRPDLQLLRHGRESRSPTDPCREAAHDAGIASTDVSIRLGYQIPNFSYGTPVSDLFPTVIAQAREAEAAGSTPCS